MTRVAVIGAGVAGLACASELLDRGVEVEVFERSSEIGQGACSWYAGGMLAPYCERESAEPEVESLGLRAIPWWKRHIGEVVERGSLVLSPRRDQAELRRFARLTREHQWLESAADIEAVEADLAGAFESALLFPDEAHIDPRQALGDLCAYIREHGGQVHFESEVSAAETTADMVIDCRGFAAAGDLPGLRGVKGEMLLLHSREIRLSRPVRLLHPRYPVYVVPRREGEFMVGATMIESGERGRISALSMLELLSAAYALDSRFGEAEIREIGVDVRPAFADNLPALRRRDNVIYVNGLFRHGFLLGPAMAERAADAVLDEARFRELPLCA